MSEWILVVATTLVMNGWMDGNWIGVGEVELDVPKEGCYGLCSKGVVSPELPLAKSGSGWPRFGYCQTI